MLKHSSQLFHIVIRLSKEDSAFFYFQLEANDGLCFYSTLEYPPHAQYRDLEMRGDLNLKNEILNIIKQCEKKFPVQILINEIIEDTITEQKGQTK